MKIYIYRHGQTLFNTKGIVQGRGVDSSLNDIGMQQAKAFYKQYQHIPFERLITSTLKRTIETAAPFEQQGLITERMPELDEIGWGVWEGKPADTEMHNAYLGLLKSWAAGNYDDALVGGDSARQMGSRLSKFVDYIKTLEHQHLLVCTHGGCMAYLMAILQAQPLSAMPQYKHRNTGLCIFEYNKGKDEFLLITHDDVSHLNLD